MSIQTKWALGWELSNERESDRLTLFRFAIVYEMYTLINK